MVAALDGLREPAAAPHPRNPHTNKLINARCAHANAGGWDKNNTVGKHAGSLLTQKIATDGE